MIYLTTSDVESDKNNNQNINPILLNQVKINSELDLRRQRVRFTKDEDDRLRVLVENFDGKIDWSVISTLMNGRTPRQCRERYCNYLRPQITNGPWTSDEDKLLEELYDKFGPQWSKIAKFFPERSDVNIKNHHSCIVNRLFRQQRDKNNTKNLIEQLYNQLE